MEKRVRLVFENGIEIEAKSFTTARHDTFCEFVFNTSMTGYQEVLTDPSYSGQAVLMTYPLIGNYGINHADHESRKVQLSAFVVREATSSFTPHHLAHTSLQHFLNEHSIHGIEGLDTRYLTKLLRENGQLFGMITFRQTPKNELVSEIRAKKHAIAQHPIEAVTCPRPYQISAKEKKLSLAIIDCGIKQNILRILAGQGCHLDVFPNTVEASQLLRNPYDGILVSNGPGDPKNLTDLVGTIRQLLGKRPLFGICLGHQLIAQALGMETTKLAFGHHGSNHPVLNLQTGKTEITAQNHDFVVLDRNMPSSVEITHRNLFDQTIAGLKHKYLPIRSVQFHPEAAPGPNDSMSVFLDFIKTMTGAKGSAITSVV